jgi:hypothetical protein
MITQDGNHLVVIEDMSIDWNLPKYRKPAKKVAARTDTSANNIIIGYDSKDGEVPVLDLTSDDEEDKMSLDESQETRMPVNVLWNSATNPGIQLLPYPQKGPGFFDRLAFWKKAPTPEPEPTLSIEDFFKSVKNTQQELVIVLERAAGYERAMVTAKKAGQTALLERLVAGLNAHKMETQLVAMGLVKFVFEEDIVRFYKQCKKGLRLDYVRNFSRVIPEAIVAKQHRANELGLFDNYVILHYDPQAKSYAETAAEKARRKDPILFGLMKGRRQLYVMGDWIDEVCDLTLDQFAEQLGADAVGLLAQPDHPYRDVK